MEKSWQIFPKQTHRVGKGTGRVRHINDHPLKKCPKSCSVYFLSPSKTVVLNTAAAVLHLVSVGSGACVDPHTLVSVLESERRAEITDDTKTALIGASWSLISSRGDGVVD